MPPPDNTSGDGGQVGSDSSNTVAHSIPTPPSMVQLAAAVLSSQSPSTGNMSDSEFVAKLAGSCTPTEKRRSLGATEPPSPPQFTDADAETDEEPGAPAVKTDHSSGYPSSSGATVTGDSMDPAPLDAQQAKLAEQLGHMPPRISLALLLEASAAAAAAEQRAEERQHDPEYLLLKAAERAKTDRYITDAINRVQTLPRLQRSMELKPVDRRDQVLDRNWSRLAAIQGDAQLLGECQRLVRGTQGCGRECDARFTNLVEFAKHVDEKHDHSFRPYMCPSQRCPWAIIGFHERSECTRHIRTKHYKAMYSCEFEGCTKVYNRSDAFRRHVRQAHASAATTRANTATYSDTKPAENPPDARAIN